MYPHFSSVSLLLLIHQHSAFQQSSLATRVLHVFKRRVCQIGSAGIGEMDSQCRGRVCKDLLARTEIYQTSCWIPGYTSEEEEVSRRNQARSLPGVDRETDISNQYNVFRR